MTVFHSDVSDLTESVALTQALIRINTHELAGKREALQLVKKLLDEKAPEARATLCDLETDAPYLTARIGTENPSGTLLFEGHLDVVPAGKMPQPFEGNHRRRLAYRPRSWGHEERLCRAYHRLPRFR